MRWRIPIGYVATAFCCAAFPRGAPGQQSATVPAVGGVHEMHDTEHAPSEQGDSALGDFLRRARAGTSAFADRRAAIAAGYRRVGMEFPAMGEHWVNPGLIIAGEFAPERPAILSYVTIAGRPALAGVVYAIPLTGRASPPVVPGLEAIAGGPDSHAASFWHEHNGTVDEESLVASHSPHAPTDTGGTRLAILHAWTVVPNQAGDLVTDNWSLPFLRLGLQVPDRIDSYAARALSLASGGAEYFHAVVVGPAQPAFGVQPLSAGAVREVDVALEECRRRVADLLSHARADSVLTAGDTETLRAAWAAVVAKVRAVAGPEVASRLTG